MAASDTTPGYLFTYDPVKNLAHAFALPRNRLALAEQVDRMLQSRDAEICELQRQLADRDLKIERWQNENAQLRGLVGNLRRALRTTGDEATAALALPIPHPPRS